MTDPLIQTRKKSLPGFDKSLISLLTLILGILGVTAGCMPAMMYGMPNASFKISGHVKSHSTGNPVQGIQVISTPITNIGSQVGTESETNITLSDGSYSLLWCGLYSSGDRGYQLEFTAIDGTTNGSYSNISTNIVFSASQLVKSDIN